MMKTSRPANLNTGVLALGAPHAVQAREGIGPGAAAPGLLGDLLVGGAITSANNGYYPGGPIYRAPSV